MSSRPLLQKGIAELEKLFDQNRDDPQFLKTLLAELSERSVPRAKELQKRVLQAASVNRVPPKAKAESETARTRAAESSHASVSVSPEPSVLAPEPVEEPSISKPVRSLEPPPPITNAATDILAAWTAMEVLSPPSFRKPEDLAGGDRLRIAPLDKDKLPWEGDGEKSRPNQKLYYQIVLGSIDMESAVSSLLQVYSDSRIERPAARGEAVLATIMVDRTGRPVASEAVAISSFGWGFPVALAGRLRDLGNWSQVERRLVEELEKKIISEDKDGNPLPLTAKAIGAAYRWLVETLGLDARFARQPVFAVRSYQYFKLQDPPESILLNSFFLDDLAKAGELTGAGQSTANLKRYLGEAKPKARRNLMKDNKALSEALEPAKFPLGAWPASGHHPLVMLQQCAVNLAMKDLASDGILAVNGPPGTGKTTLLRDIVAAIVTKRAELLCKFDDPEDAFAPSGQKIKRGSAFIHLYKLDEKLRGHEIIVASSNNKAVENVSAELPGMGAIADDATGLR